MRKTKTESLKTRQYLLLAALEVFYRQGVTRCTLQEIAQAAGVTRGALYWHFKNKEELFEALFEQVFDNMFAQEQPEALDNAWLYLRQQLLQIFQLIANSEMHYKFCNVLHLKCERTPHNETITSLAERYHDMFITRIERILQLCYEQGRLPENIDLPLASVYLQSNCIGLMKFWVVQPERFDLKQDAEKLIDATLQALQTNPFLLKKV